MAVPHSDFRWLRVGETLRYAADADSRDPEVDGFPNYHFVTSPVESGFKRMMLMSGINPTADIVGPDGPRRPAIALRSSPWKAGQTSNPWHDEFDMDHGYIRDFGDHKPETLGIPGVTAGNRSLLEAYPLYGGSTHEARALAPPLLVYRAVPRELDGQMRQKGFVEFCGVALIERLEHVVQRDPDSGKSFPNIVIDLAVVEPDSSEGIDMRWIDDRRDPNLSASEALRYAPKSWLRWVAEGRTAVPRIRRRVLSTRVKTREDQLPVAGSDAEGTLDLIYRFFDGRKHRLELLASRVAGEVLQKSGATYHPGWLTRAGGDGGVDFVGRLDVGSVDANTPLVILGQAKCIAPNSSISPDQVARVVARLRRGWLGVFVTTGAFSKRAQIEVIDDQYPVVLIPGRVLAEEVRRLAAAGFDGDVQALLNMITKEYAELVTSRRPEEIMQA